MYMYVLQKCEIIRDWKSVKRDSRGRPISGTGDSLGYGFVEFHDSEAAERAYFKMDNVLIDDRRIRVDFSQSVAKLWNRYRRNERLDKGDEVCACTSVCVSC